MSNELLMLFSIGIVISVYLFTRLQARLQRTESKLDALLKHFELVPENYLTPSEQVIALAKNPATRIQAIKAYRQQTGLGLKEAKEVIDNLISSL